MQRYLTVGLLCLLAAGCTNSTTSEEYEWATKVCESNGGISRVIKAAWFYPDVECKNGARFAMDSDAGS